MKRLPLGVWVLLAVLAVVLIYGAVWAGVFS